MTTEETAPTSNLLERMAQEEEPQHHMEAETPTKSKSLVEYDPYVKGSAFYFEFSSNCDPSLVNTKRTLSNPCFPQALELLRTVSKRTGGINCNEIEAKKCRLQRSYSTRNPVKLN